MVGQGKIRAVALLVAVAVVAALVAGALTAKAGAGGGGSKGNLLWVQPLRDHPVHRLMQAGFMQRCKQIGWTCEIVGNPSASEFDVPATIALAEASLARKEFKAAGIYSPDPAIYPFIRKVSKQGLPVVSWHIPIKQGTVQGLTATTGTDPAAYARASAVAIGRRIGGRGTVAVTEGSFNTVENLVAKTFTATMKQRYPNVKVLKPQVEGFEPSAAIAKAVSILQANQDVTAAFSTTGGGPATWAGAQRQAGKKLVIIGMDYVRQNLDLVRKGEVYAVVGQPLYEESARTADLLAALASGKKVPYSNNLPAPIITKAKLGKYYALLKRAGQ